MKSYDVIVVGGGLAGLALADLLHRQGKRFVLLEARNRLGGRIKSDVIGKTAFDMGPAWFWPGQPRMAKMVDRFGLAQFDQYASGALSVEDERGRVQRGAGFSSMQGSYRLEGGLQTLTAALVSALPADQILTTHRVQVIERVSDGVSVQTEGGHSFKAERVVLAVPPRVAAAFQYVPSLDHAVVQNLRDVPTWMAGQAKAVAVYDSAFWRDAGLSGDAMSRFGPMVELHDASPKDAHVGALFGFIGVPPNHRLDEAKLRQQICDQLGRLFGAQGAEPKSLLLKDWAIDPFTSTELDLAPMYAHPQYGMPVALSNVWDGQILFGGTEVADTFGGYLEGALEAAEQTFATLEQSGVAA